MIDEPFREDSPSVVTGMRSDGTRRRRRKKKKREGNKLLQQFCVPPLGNLVSSFLLGRDTTKHSLEINYTHVDRGFVKGLHIFIENQLYCYPGHSLPYMHCAGYEQNDIV
jgi:hypothetical protein